MRTWSLGLLLVIPALAGAALPACGVFGSEDPPAEAPTDAQSEPPLADAAPSAPDAFRDPDASDGAPTCEPVVETATIDADAFVTLGGCDGANSFGATTNINASSSFFALVRFRWSAAAETAALAGRLSSVALGFDQNPTCNGTCGTNAHTPGVFSVHALRTDWDEGNGTPYNGPDGCRRTIGTGGGTGKGWGLGDVTVSASTHIAAGVDFGTSSIADFTLAPGGTKLTFTIAGSSALFLLRNPNKIAFLVLGGPGASFFGASKESVMHPAPSLIVTYCK